MNVSASDIPISQTSYVQLTVLRNSDEAQQVAQDLKIGETDDLEVTLEDQVAWLKSHRSGLAGKHIPALGMSIFTYYSYLNRLGGC